MARLGGTHCRAAGDTGILIKQRVQRRGRATPWVGEHGNTSPVGEKRMRVDYPLQNSHEK